MSERVGRKRALLSFSLPMILCHLISAFANRVYMFLVARFLMGVGIGGVYSIVPNYVTEIGEDKNRGLLGCTMSLMIAFGNVFVYAVGPFVSVQLLSFLNLVPLVMFLVCFGGSVPETPQHHIKTNNRKKAEDVLRLFRSKNCNLQEEFAKLVKSMEMENSKGSLKDLLTTKPITRALIIVIGLMVLQQFSGINAVLCYMETIFGASKSSYPPEYSVIFVGVVQLITTAVTTQLVDKVGRKFLLLLSSIGSSLSLVCLSVYFYLNTNNYNVESILWLPLVSLIVYIIVFNSGLSCIPWAILGELFPSHVKSLSSSITSMVNLVLAFCITMFFPHLAEILGLASTFLLCASFCATGAVFTFVLVPETKGKSLEDIQKILSG
ncbi:facilitated trehalose transporter Tret1-like isoform X2 [Aethina tumida]|nr:facilitated trehalose transporter Tret1-like isoform X2 [Aethina tumida]